jgi:hypothetical protein
MHVRIGLFLHPGQAGDTDAIYSRLGVIYVDLDEQETGMPRSFAVKLYSFLHSGIASTQRQLQQRQMPFFGMLMGVFCQLPISTLLHKSQKLKIFLDFQGKLLQQLLVKL